MTALQGRAAGCATLVALSALCGAAAGSGRLLLSGALAIASAAAIVLAGRRAARAVRAEDEARRELTALVEQRTAELDRRSRELDENLKRLDVARSHLGVTDRLAAVGRLAAGVAHEVNNPLAVTLTNVSWLREVLPAALRGARAEPGTPPSEEILDALAEAESASQRVARIVRDLQDFAKERSGGQGAADLVSVLQHVERLVAHEVRARARLAIDLPASHLVVNGSGARLGQLFAHLLLHAAHAAGGGRAEDNEVRVTARADEGGAIVEVSHTGRGLDPEALAHVFDPFYAIWSGDDDAAGLGLAVCHGLVRALGGEIAAESSPECGSLYRVKLPFALSESRIALCARAVPRPRVLVVDDDPLACASLYRVLSPHFDVVPHTSASHALALVRAGERFDAVLCDLMMPEMSGIAFYEELTRLAPALAAQVVFLTAGAFTAGAREFLAQVPNARLLKPYEPAELIATLQAQCAPPVAQAV